MKEQKDEADHCPIIGLFEGFLILIKKYRNCLIIGCMLQFFQQFSGINTALYYGPNIIQQTGLIKENEPIQALWVSLALTSANALGTIITLFVVDRFG